MPARRSSSAGARDLRQVEGRQSSGQRDHGDRRPGKEIECPWQAGFTLIVNTHCAGHFCEGIEAGSRQVQQGFNTPSGLSKGAHVHTELCFDILLE